MSLIVWIIDNLANHCSLLYLVKDKLVICDCQIKMVSKADKSLLLHDTCRQYERA